ncbi:hypothetical protein P8625_43 [Verrucomicrobia phage P8625]|uniref:hypothetical protein n=1 Tax=Verrucomicrobia phage P8625 TaxID=1636271 RepID=UPI0005FEB3F0|nr:hypothetical protein AWI59_gp43 [Verrucomicrobia phage P8625]AKA60294.1 hypothetical protein P8625_43 [Verrucomicrobia phage P8625]
MKNDKHENADSALPSSSGSGITANQEALAKDIARSLHEMSILRHGMFTPVDFEAIVANRIRSFFHSQNTEIGQSDEQKTN